MLSDETRSVLENAPVRWKDPRWDCGNPRSFFDLARGSTCYLRSQEISPTPLFDRDGVCAMISSGSKWYSAGEETAMIELTEVQMQSLENAEVTPPRVVNPRTKEIFVLLRVDEFQRLTQGEYDDSPWTREELQALAWERVKHEDWAEYDDPPEQP